MKTKEIKLKTNARVGKPSRKITDKEEIRSLRSNPPLILNSAEASVVFGIHVRTIRAYKKRFADFPAHQKTPRSEMVIYRDELIAWFKERGALTKEETNQQ
jgi:hypothetical protein